MFFNTDYSLVQFSLKNSVDKFDLYIISNYLIYTHNDLRDNT